MYVGMKCGVIKEEISMNSGRARMGGLQEMATIRFLDGALRNLKGIGRDLDGYWKQMDITDPRLDRAMGEAVSGMGDVLRELSAAMGIARSIAMNQEVSFISSDKQAARELVKAAEELG